MTANLPWPKTPFNLSFYVKSHLWNFRKAFTFFGKRFLFSVGVSLLLGVAMVLPASLWLFFKNLVNVDQEWNEKPGLVVYLELGTSDDEVEKVYEELLSLNVLQDPYIVPADEGLRQFSNLTGVGDLKELLGANPLPFSIQGYFADHIDYYDYEKLKIKIEKMDLVDDVVLEIEWIENLREITELVNFLLVIYVILFAIASAFISFTSIRIVIEDRLAEIKILKLVGATNAQIRRPYLYCGVLYGLVGAIAGLVIVTLTMTWMYEPLRFLTDSNSIGLSFFGVSPIFALLVLICGALVGWIGAIFGVQLQMKKLELL